MPKPVLSVPAISYALSIFYGTSFFVYLTSLIPSLGELLLLVLFSLILFFCTLSAAKLKENARRNLINFNILLWGYSLFLFKSYPDLVPLSYIWMYLVVCLFFSLPSVKAQFLPVGSGVRKSILVVDDDEGILRTVQQILLANGYSVLTAASGEKGIQIANLQKPDLILLDVILPGIKGREVCQRLKEDANTKDIPVIFLTAKDSPDDIQAEKEAGAINHLTKPVNARVLLAEVKKIFS